VRRRGDTVVCSAQPNELGPLTSRKRAQLAARALQGVEWETLEDALPKLRAKLKRLARDLRFEDAARLRDRIDALEEAAREIRRMQQLRQMQVVLVAGGRAVWVAKGQVVSVRPWGGASGLEWQAGLAAVARAEPTLAPEAADDLRVLATFIRRPPPELQVIRLAHSAGWIGSANERSAEAGASSSSTA
jgi:hypothetical protein